jgi:hypothetical protein
LYQLTGRLTEKQLEPRSDETIGTIGTFLLQTVAYCLLPVQVACRLSSLSFILLPLSLKHLAHALN